MLDSIVSKVLDTKTAHMLRRARRFFVGLYLSTFIAKPLEATNVAETQRGSKVIWQLWDDGNWNQAKTHLLVRMAIRSVIDFSKANGYQHRMLSFKEGLDLLEVPDQIRRKFEKNIISKAQMSDIIRAGLLGKFGGIWMDATLYIYDFEGSEGLLREDLFISHTTNWSRFNGDFFFDSYLIACRWSSPLLRETYDALIRFWSSRSFILDYFQFHILLSLIVKDSGIRPEFITDPSAPSRMHAMQRALWSSRRADDITVPYPIQKLTHKIPIDHIRGDNSIFLEMLKRFQS